MVVTITGANDLLRRAELDRLTKVFLDEFGDMALERLDGEEASGDRILASIQSMPFLSSRKMIVLREPGKQKIFAEGISDILKDIPEITDLIIYEPKLDKRAAYYKTLKKSTDFREFGDLDTPALYKWLINYAAEQGGSLTQQDAKLLIDRLGPNQQLLKSELDKLLVYDKTITRDHIELLTEPLPQSTIFELLDAAFSGNKKRAFELYYEQRALKVDPQAIIAMLAWQLHVLALIKAGAPRTADQIAKEAKLNPFVVRKTQAIARRLSIEQIKVLIADLLSLDKRFKSTPIDTDEALQLYLLKLAGG